MPRCPSDVSISVIVRTKWVRCALLEFIIGWSGDATRVTLIELIFMRLRGRSALGVPLRLEPRAA
jgi:hypothetical protein